MSADTSLKTAHSRSKLRELAAELLERKQRGAGKLFLSLSQFSTSGVPFLSSLLRRTNGDLPPASRLSFLHQGFEEPATVASALTDAGRDCHRGFKPEACLAASSPG